MQLYTRIEPLRKLISEFKSKNQKIAFVPTMGALHLGHLALIRKAKELGDVTAVSIFVNPAQFNNRSDLEVYPRDLKSDLDLLQPEHVDFVFAPQEEELYTEDFNDWVAPPAVAEPLEGTRRPGHFRGVTTVVSLLFKVIEPDFALFGEKDFQQVRVIEEMTRELKLPVQIVRVPTVREEKGLALSSRNARLSKAEYDAAQLISKGLSAAIDDFRRGEKASEKLIARAKAVMSESGLIQLEYLEIVDEQTLLPVSTPGKNSRLMAAAKVGAVRLIDNAPFPDRI